MKLNFAWLIKLIKKWIEKKEKKPEPVPEPVVDPDIEAIKKLRWNSVADPCLVPAYCGWTNQFEKIAMLPKDFTCTLNNSGANVTKPASDDNNLREYPGDHMQKRRMFLCVFDCNGNLLKAMDWANGFYHDNRWRDLPVTQAVCVHCRKGAMISRSQLWK